MDRMILSKPSGIKLNRLKNEIDILLEQDRLALEKIKYKANQIVLKRILNTRDETIKRLSTENKDLKDKLYKAELELSTLREQTNQQTKLIENLQQGL